MIARRFAPSMTSELAARLALLNQIETLALTLRPSASSMGLLHRMQDLPYGSNV